MKPCLVDYHAGAARRTLCWDVGVAFLGKVCLFFSFFWLGGQILSFAPFLEEDSIFLRFTSTRTNVR